MYAPKGEATARRVLAQSRVLCFDPPLMMGVKNDANETHKGSICVKYISRVDVEVI